MYQKLITTAVLFIGVLFPLSVFAHVTGASWNATSSPYVIDVGYDPVTFVAGNYTRFDFVLWRGAVNTGDHAEYAQVWVRILNEESHDTHLATGIWHQFIGPTTLLYRFAEPGHYVLETSFRDSSGNDIAVGSFPIVVEQSKGPFRIDLLASGALGIVIGALIAWYIARRKS